MEGRWAQLAVDAHIAHAIDYSRPVKPHIERAIFRRLELNRDIARSAAYPSMDDKGTTQWLGWEWSQNFIVNKLTPWRDKIIAKETDIDIRERIKQLQQIQKH